MNSQLLQHIRITVFCVCLAFAGTASAADLVTTISPEELKAEMNGADIVILDVRADEHWEKAEFKIKGAERVSPDDPDWLEKYPKEKSIVLYCA